MVIGPVPRLDGGVLCTLGGGRKGPGKEPGLRARFGLEAGVNRTNL